MDCRGAGTAWRDDLRATREETISNTERLAIEVIADRIRHGELPSSALNVSFQVLSEQLAGD